MTKAVECARGSHWPLNAPLATQRITGVQEVLQLELDPTEVEMLRKPTDVLKASIATLELERELVA
jgi:hypothetical protein